jgi:hypothetical protein
MPSSQCGQHVELASNASVRVTRCSCGTVHVTLLGSGVTVRMSGDALKGVAAGMHAAVDRLDEAPHLGGATIN